MSGDTCIIPLGTTGEYEAVVSIEDYAFLTQWRWNIKKSTWQYGRKVYARRNTWENGRRVSIYMHNVILRDRMGAPQPSPDHEVDHADVDSLNNTRGNLSWATKSEQNANQRQRITKAQTAAYAVASAAAEVPF